MTAVASAATTAANDPVGTAPTRQDGTAPTRQDGTVQVRPERLRGFGDPAGATFCLVSRHGTAEHLAVDPGGAYDDYRVLTLEDGEAFPALLAERVPPRSHVLVVTPGRLFESPTPAEIGERKLLVMPCGSTPAPPDAVAHFLDVMERTDPEAQEAFAERFFTIAEESDHLDVVDDAAGTSATFEHFAGDYEWNQQAGPVDWGEQQVAPSGELSALPAHVNRFDPSLRLAVDGTVALRGIPIVHSGAASFTLDDQARVHAALATMAEHPVVAEIEAGVITAVRAAHPDAAPAAEMFDALFRVDSRYRIVWEMGFGINTAMEPAPGNVAMNEVYGGIAGVFHLGIGLTPYTQYAVIVSCPRSRVVGAGGQELVSGVAATTSRKRRIQVTRDGGGCGCRG